MSLFSHVRCWAVRLGLVALFPLVAWSQGTYTTNFPLTENPISENGRWINGGTTGLDWTNIRTTPQLAFGTMPGNAGGNAEYADSTAVLAGNWGANQTVQATIAVSNASNSSGVFEELELRVLTTVTAHSITGYEINCSVNPSNRYVQIVRWNGPIANWTELNGTGSVGGVNGDVFMAKVSGGTITVYLNGVQVLQATDNTFTSGSPGIGWFLQGATGLNANYGFSNFSATDGSAPTPTPTPTPIAAPTAPQDLKIVP